MSDVTWLPVPGYEGTYEVSDAGSVRSVDRIIDHPVTGPTLRRGRVLKAATTAQGYKRVKLSKGGSAPLFSVHSIVMLAFAGPRPDGFHVCHNNGEPADNRLQNLRYDTPSENAFDSIAHGTCFQAAKDRCPEGHPYDASNTRIVKTTFGSRVGRQCRECDRLRQLAKRAANREAYNAAARERRRAKREAAAA